MSFSKRFTGTAIALIAAVAAFPAEQKSIDEKGGAGPGVIDGHQKQIAAAIAEVNPVIEAAASALPDAELSVGIWGHANEEQTGSFNWDLRPSSDRPTPS
jgi:hypothetical protein